jgi:hypothetical protein
MALLVASKHTFSSAGITISKHWNHLDTDIVKALQCLKSLISQEDLMLRPFPSLAEEEVSMDDADLQHMNQEGTSNEVINDQAEWEFEAIAEDASNEIKDADDVWVVL